MRAGNVRLRADAGYFAGELPAPATTSGLGSRSAPRGWPPLWRLLAGIDAEDWGDAIDMTGALVAVATYCPGWWPANTRLLIRSVAYAAEQVSPDTRSRRRRTLHPDQRALRVDELADADQVYGYSFILINIPARVVHHAGDPSFSRHRRSKAWRASWPSVCVAGMSPEGAPATG
ncbi:hypothetical protein [Jiangella aurantiaca]|uniref:hypothetical protein n=1 Tax=Jiangella aurantiaca TaxID=2530373 RepID=UPI0013A5C8B4|nr:hypothetical protein [Jiangella aurantiaca]